MSQAVKVFLFYVAISLAMIKFALNSQATELLTQVIALAGMGQALGCLLGVWYSKTIFEHMKQDLHDLASKLGLVAPRSSLTLMHNAVLFAGFGGVSFSWLGYTFCLFLPNNWMV